jgi:hypothetical protein
MRGHSASARTVTPRIRKLVIAVELLVGIGALFGGYGLLDDADQ